MAKQKKSTRARTARTTKRATATRAANRKSRTIVARPGSFDTVNRTRTKSQLLGQLSQATGLSKKEISAVIESLTDLVGHDLKKGPGSFTLPGLIKMKVVRKPATKARRGLNPFTGQEMTFKAKPARNVVRVRPLKTLKDKVV